MVELSSKKGGEFYLACKAGIPSAEALGRRNILVPYSMCGLFANMEESENHILTSCSLAMDTISMVLNWCGILPQYFSGVNEVLALARNLRHCPKKKEVLACILYGTIWSPWKARNYRIFSGESSKSANIVDS